MRGGMTAHYQPGVGAMMRGMSDESIAARIEQLVAEEHELRNREQDERSDAGALATETERLDAVQVELDRCWDLLRQRRALRSAGGDPDSGRAPRRGHGRALPPVGVSGLRLRRDGPAAAWPAPRARSAASSRVGRPGSRRSSIATLAQ